MKGLNTSRKEHIGIVIIFPVSIASYLRSGEAIEFY